MSCKSSTNKNINIKSAKLKLKKLNYYTPPLLRVVSFTKLDFDSIRCCELRNSLIQKLCVSDFQLL